MDVTVTVILYTFGSAVGMGGGCRPGVCVVSVFPVQDSTHRGPPLQSNRRWVPVNWHVVGVTVVVQYMHSDHMHAESRMIPDMVAELLRQLSPS